MKQNIGRLSAFFIGFLVTIMLSILVSFVLISLYRMENTISANGYIVLDVKKNSENEVEIIALNKKYILDISKISENIPNFSTFDVLIPAEIRTFFCVTKSSIDVVEIWFESILN